MMQFLLPLAILGYFAAVFTSPIWIDAIVCWVRGPDMSRVSEDAEAEIQRCEKLLLNPYVPPAARRLITNYRHQKGDYR